MTKTPRAGPRHNAGKLIAPWEPTTNIQTVLSVRTKIIHLLEATVGTHLWSDLKPGLS